MLGGGGSLSPFGSSGVSFDAFNIAASIGEQAYLIFRRKEVEWEQGKLSNADYLTALQGYANALPEGSEKLNAQVRYEDTKYRVERNSLIADIADGKKEWSDLLTFDQAKLDSIQLKDSAAYDEQLANVREVQSRMFSEEEDVMREKYNDGKITSAQLQRWYQGVLDGNLTADNPDLEDQVTKQLDGLNDAVLAERDSKMVTDFNSGKVGYNEFLAYGNAARGRYAKGTTQYDDWTQRLDDAKTQSVEQSLTYRYGLTQRYQQLAKFVADHGTAPTGHTVTSKGSKGTPRVVWTGSGWKTVYSGGSAGGTRTVGPSASEVKAWKALQVEVKDAKRQMSQIANQVAKLPGGWVSTGDMIRYYSQQQGKYVKGTPEWYNVQERLDSLNQQAHAETVLRAQGIRISYPKVKSEGAEVGTAGVRRGTSTSATPAAASSAASAPKAGASAKSGDREVGLDEFMRAIARVESGGRYDAVNKSSGAKGKYQIMPGNWAGWAKKYLGDPNAKWTPENQEKVARGKFQDLYKWLGDWRAVAHWWLTGGSNKDLHRDPDQWSTSSRKYVNKVFAGLGLSPTRVSAGAITRGHTSPGSAAAAPPGGGGGASMPVTSLPKTTTTTKSGVVERSPYSIPKGLDGRQFERFYDRFLEAYNNGEESFTDYSSGKAVTYWIPMDLEERSKLVGYLDEVRIGAFAERAKAYAGTASEEVAMTNYSDAVKKAGENQIMVIDTIARPKQNEYVGTMNLRPDNRNEAAAKAYNPLAEGLKLKERTAATLDAYAARAKEAFARGDDEAAYGLIQQALSFAATNEGILNTYFQSAKANIAYIKGKTATTTPEMVTKDLADLASALDLDRTDGTVSPDYAKALTSLEETSGELDKYLKFDANDEPVKQPTLGDDTTPRYVLKDGVDLILKPDGSIEHKQTRFDGYVDPSTGLRDSGEYTTVTVKIGQQIKQVKAQWRSGVVGYVKGSNTPIMGKVITGQMDGKEYIWLENPFAAGKWIKGDPNQALSIDAPAGFKAITGPDGTASLEFQSAGGPKGNAATYRLQWDKATGAYHIYEAPGLFSTDWVDRGSTAGKDVAGLASILQSAGWKVDTSNLKDQTFANTTGAWIGFDPNSYKTAIRNSAGPGQMPRAVPKILIPGQRYTVSGQDTWQDAQTEKMAARSLQKPLPTPYNDGMTSAEKTKAAAFGAKPTLPAVKSVSPNDEARAEKNRIIALKKKPAGTRAKSAGGPKSAASKPGASKPAPARKPVVKPKKLPVITPVRMHEATGTNTYSGGR